MGNLPIEQFCQIGTTFGVICIFTKSHKRRVGTAPFTVTTSMSPDISNDHEALLDIKAAHPDRFAD